MQARARIFEVHVASRGGEGRGGWGAAFREGGSMRRMGGEAPSGGPAAMQAEAAAEALLALPEGSRARVVTPCGELLGAASRGEGPPPGVPEGAWERLLRVSGLRSAAWTRTFKPSAGSVWPIQDSFAALAAREEALAGSLGAASPGVRSPGPSCAGERPAGSGGPEGAWDVWVDGSGLRDGRGGWGAVLLSGRKGGAGRALAGRGRRWSGSTGDVCSRMELVAAAEALEATPEGARVRIRSDFQTLVRSMGGQARTWRRCGWRLARGGLLADWDVWDRLLRADGARDVEWLWVRSSSCPGHRLAHRLAGRAAPWTEACSSPLLSLPGGAEALAGALAEIVAAGPAPGEGTPLRPDRGFSVFAAAGRRGGFLGWGAEVRAGGAPYALSGEASFGRRFLGALEAAAKALEALPHGVPVRLCLGGGPGELVSGLLHGGGDGGREGRGGPPSFEASLLGRISDAAALLEVDAGPPRDRAEERALGVALKRARSGAAQARGVSFAAFRRRLRDAPWRVEGRDLAQAMFEALESHGLRSGDPEGGAGGPLEGLSAAEAGGSAERALLEGAAAPFDRPGVLGEDARRALGALGAGEPSVQEEGASQAAGR